MSERHLFDLIDLELVEESPMSWSDNDWEVMGMCRGKLRSKREHLVYILMHGLVTRAMKAYKREGLQSPWGDDYCRTVFVIPGETDIPQPETPQDFLLAAVAYLSTPGGCRRKDLLIKVATLTSSPHSYLNTLIDKMVDDNSLRRVGHGLYDLSAASKKLPMIKAILANAKGAQA